MNINQKIDLALLRKNAKISQADMAEHLGLSQSQVSRYEQDPDEVSQRHVRAWAAYCGLVAGSQGVDVGNPRLLIQERIKLIADYAQSEPQKPDSILDSNIPVKFEPFIQGFMTVARKPRVGVFGRFDAGKSRLCNTLLGGDSLPTSYTPATSVICLIRHISDKPAWQIEDVWMMKKGFDFNEVDSQQHCQSFKFCAGGFDILQKYGTHQETSKEQNAFAAIVYVDAPILLACDMLDLPGYNNSDDDQDRAEMGHQLADVLLYLSPSSGFIDQSDLGYISTLLRLIPAYETPENNLKPLCNLMIVATRADQVGDQINLVLDKSATRSYKHLVHTLSERTAQTKVPISESDFRKRYFKFNADSQSMRADFETSLKELLTEILPNHTLEHMNKHVLSAKESATSQCDKWINGLISALDSREKAQESIRILQREEPTRLQKKRLREDEVLSLIDDFKRESAENVAKTFSDMSSVEAINSMIQHRYGKDKKEAKELAPSFLLESIQKRINDAARDKAKKLSVEVDDFLEDYLSASVEKDLTLNNSWNFNAKGVFMGSLAGLGTFGALAGWASIAAAGSNLGAYLLIPTVVSALSSIGIGVGGTSAAISAVAAIGGPITIGLGLAFIAFMVGWNYLGDNWRTGLAKKINKHIIEQGTEKLILDSNNKHWDDTKLSFTRAVAETEAAYQSKLVSLYNLAFSTSRDVILLDLEYAREMRNFFGGIPWSPFNADYNQGS